MNFFLHIHSAIVGLFILFYSDISAQTPYYYTLNEDKGLPSNEIYQSIQDKFGYIWIGCDAGLYKYDGIRYKKFKNRFENGRSISELRIDKNQRIWCQNFNGQIYYVNKDSLVLFEDFSSTLRNSPQYTIDDYNNVWVCGGKKILKMNVDGDTISILSHTKNKSDSINWLDVETLQNQDVMLIGASGEIAIIKNNNKPKIECIQTLPNCNRAYLQNIGNQIAIVTNNKASQQQQIFIWSNAKSSLIANIADSILVYKVVKTDSNTISLCTSNGVKNIIKKNLNYEVSQSLFVDDKISSYLIDREKNHWITSLQNGIFIIPNINLIEYNKQNSNLNDNFISNIADVDDKLIIGTYLGYIYELEKNKIELKPILPIDKKSDYRYVKKIVPFNSGLLLSRGNFCFTDFKTTTNYKLRNVRDFVLFKDTVYYASSYSIGWLAFKSDPNHHDIELKAGKSVAIDTSARIVYYATSAGLQLLKDNKLKQIDYNNNRINVTKLLFWQNKLWIATQTNKLLSHNNNKTIIETKINELIKGEVIKTFTIHKNILWAATEKSLSKINLITLRANYYDFTDGIISSGINDIKPFNQKIYIATNKGLICFPENLPSLNVVKPNIAIESCYIKGQKFNVKKGLILDYRSNNIKFIFNSSCIKGRNSWFFKYRMIGIDSNWTLRDAFTNEVIYSSLPPGTFTFEVKAVNEDGIESEKSDTIVFKIKKPFWQQIWFYFTIALSSALIVFVTSLVIIKNIKNKAIIKTELTNTKLTAIRAQMNPHFMYNTLNSIQDLILKSDIKNTNYYLSKFSSLMRKILEFSESEKIVLEDEIEMLNDYLELEKLRFGDDFKYEINCSKEIKTDKLFIPSLIIQPFVENAIKHGLLHKKGEKGLNVTFSISQNKLLVTIEDNGVGRKRSEEIKSRSKLQHKSFATSAVKKRLELLNSNEISVINFTIFDLHTAGESVGTKVEITISC